MTFWESVSGEIKSKYMMDNPEVTEIYDRVPVSETKGISVTKDGDALQDTKKSKEEPLKAGQRADPSVSLSPKHPSRLAPDSLEMRIRSLYTVIH